MLSCWSECEPCDSHHLVQGEALFVVWRKTHSTIFCIDGGGKELSDTLARVFYFMHREILLLRRKQISFKNI